MQAVTGEGADLLHPGGLADVADGLGAAHRDPARTGERFTWTLGPVAVLGWAALLGAASAWVEPWLLVALVVVPLLGPGNRAARSVERNR